MARLDTAQERMMRARLFVGLDQTEMAKLLGKSKSTISGWERGLSEPPLSSVAQWALVTGRTIDWLAWGDSRPVNDETPANVSAGVSVRPEGFEPPAF